MKNLRLIALCSGGLFATASLLIVACGDDTIFTPGVDGGGEADGSKADGPVIVTDASPKSDADADADIDPTFDAGLKVETFAEEVATRYCRSLARCCFGNPNIDAGVPVDGGDSGTFDRAKCAEDAVRTGFESSNFGAQLTDGGNVGLEQRSAADCLARVESVSCQLAVPELQAARTACFGAFRGKRALTEPCRGSIECVNGAFCKGASPDFSAVGACASVRAVNGNCGDFTTDTNLAEEACSYRSGGGSLHCSTYTDPQGDPQRTEDWKCVPDVAIGGSCALSNWCASGVCDPDKGFKCELSAPYYNPFACGYYLRR